MLDAEQLRVVIQDAVRAFIDAEEALAECLREAGFDYKSRTVDVAVTSEHGGLRTRGEIMRTVGYGIVDGEAGAGVQVSIRGGSVPASQHSEYELAISSGGACEKQVNYIDIQDAIQRFQDTPPELASRFLADRRLIAAQNGWSRCMKSEGYAFDNPFQAFDHIEAKLNRLPFDGDQFEQQKSELAAEEIRVATADLECYDQHMAEVVAELYMEQSQ